jgi:caffeoyl-CoA O-methyltransferase
MDRPGTATGDASAERDHERHARATVPRLTGCMRSTDLDDGLLDYLLAHANPSRDEVSERLAAVTRERFPDRAGMNVGGDQGRLLEMLVAVTGARLVVEIGTFTGMSALWLARGLTGDGRLVCFDLTDEYADTARAAWREAGVDDRIDLRIGPAGEGIAALPDDEPIDLAFIDADKTGYRGYLDQLVPRLSERGLVVVDNVLWSGSVNDPDDHEPSTVALREFNDHVAHHAELAAVMLPIGDGITLIRRR